MNLLKRLSFFILTSIFCNFSYSQNVIINDSLYLKAKSFRFKNPDSSVYFLQKGHTLKLKEKDTTNAINYLIELGELYSHTIDYGKSYDRYWEALILADKSEDSISKANIYKELGLLYGYYKRHDEAVKYLNLSNKVRKSLVNSFNKEWTLPFVGSNYFTLANFYRDIKDYDNYRVYLDSSQQIQNMLPKSAPKSYYLEAEFGYLASIDRDFDTALKKLKNAKEYFEVHDPSYLVLIHMFYGDVYSDMDKLNESIIHYEKSLGVSNKYKSHLNINLQVYESLSNIYFKQRRFEKAHNYLKKAKELNENIFGRNSSNSRHLLEIKDLYRIEKEKQEDLIKQQTIKKLKHEEKVWFLQSIILIVTIIFLMLFGFLFIRHIRQKHNNEKLILKERQKLKLQKTNEILELKNKELTESALRIIEKDEFITSIKNRLANQKDNVDVNVIRRILKYIQRSPSSNWSEFELRFTAVNQSFYKKLKKNYPSLKQTDLKLCALIKLNFQSKDIAKLLGIEVKSVHTSRSRLRKKLNLSRNENLEEFINSL